MKRKFLYQQITDDIKDRIVSKQYHDGDMLESNMHLMKRYNASKLTVNKALQLLAQQGYIKRIPGKGSIVQFREIDTHYQFNNPQIIGTLVDDIAQSDMWASVLKSVEKFLFPLQYQLLFGSNIGDINSVMEYVDQYYKQGVRGILYVPLSAANESEYYSINNKVIEHIENYNIEYIITHNYLRKSSTVQISFDNYNDACILTEAIIKSGHKHPAVISPNHYNSTIDERERGVLDTLKKYGAVDTERTIIKLPYKENINFITVLNDIISNHPDIDAIIGIDEYYFSLLHKSIQSDICCADSGMLVSGFGQVDERLTTNTIHIYQRLQSELLGEIAISNLLSNLNQPDIQANHIIRVPSELVTKEVPI